MEFRVLNRVESYNNNSGRINEIASYNGKKFKLIADIHNGGKVLKAELMDKEGIFQFVLGSADVNFEYSASYVSSRIDKALNLEQALNELKKVIKKVY